VNLKDYLLGHLPAKEDVSISSFHCFEYAVCLLVLPAA